VHHCWCRSERPVDLPFLPLNHGDRSLDLSRFDIGGIRSARSTNQLTAFLFSDRASIVQAITIHIGTITKTADWSKDLSGIPLESEILRCARFDSGAHAIQVCPRAALRN